MPVFTEQVDNGLRFAVPYALMAVLFILNITFLSFPLSYGLEPPLILMMIYYWSIYRPTLVPVWLVFTVGLLFDFISALPIGLHGFIYIAVRWLVTDQRLLLASQSFFAVWTGFVVVSLLSVVLEWTLFGLINMHWPPFAPSLSIFLSGVFLFPFVSITLHLTHKLLPAFTDQYGMTIKKTIR